MTSSFLEQLLALTPSLFPLAKRLEEAAANDVPVLLTGATGTGKTHLARLLHNFSPRREHRFVVVPCGALDRNLLLSELFGQFKHTSQAEERVRAGRLDAAGLGTLLLDDVDTLSLEAQAALLRVIQTGSYRPIGSRHKHLCQSRILAAANGDLEQAVVEGRFHRELFLRLNALSFYLPPLSRRQEDVEPLARAMVVSSAHKFRKNPPFLRPETLRVLQAFDWPGNIRQLETSIQQAVLVSSGDELRIEHLPKALRLSFSRDAERSANALPFGSRLSENTR